MMNSGGSGEYVTQAGGSPLARMAKLAITNTVKMIDIQR